jgi:RNA polymerase sigma factor (sigma-70 family)
MPAPVFKLLAAVSDAEPDADLLARFVSARDDDAFAELVRRHGPAVYHTCRRLVGPSAADDAFQATFLVFAARAGSVRKAASVGSWLVGVAGRVGRRMRVRSQKAEGRGQGTTDPDQLPGTGIPPDLSLQSADLSATLTDEFTRLPDRLRATAVACLVDGRTQEQAAAVLGWSSRTVRRRLDEAKGLLRARLERRGVTPAAAVAALGAVGEAAAVPAGLSRRATDAATLFLAGGGAHVPAAALAHGVIGTMRTFSAPAAAAACLAVLAGLGIGWAGDSQPPAQPPPAKTAPAPKVDLIPPPAAKAPPAAPALHTHKTANFVVEAPTAAVARAVGDEFEVQRAAAAKAWLGKELPAWQEPTTVRVELHPAGNFYSGTVRFRAVPGAEHEATMGNPLDALLAVEVPKHAARLVLVTRLGRRLPRWADCAVEGVAGANQDVIYARCFGHLIDGRALRLANLFTTAGAKSDWGVYEAQGFAVAKFLLARAADLAASDFQATRPPDGIPDTPRGRFVAFVAAGVAGNTVASWDAAAKDMYGIDSVDRMEAIWLDWLRRNPLPRDGAEHTDPLRIPPVDLTVRPEPPAVPAGSGTARSKHFLVTAPTASIAAEVAAEAERHRRELAKAWLGKELPDRAEPIPVTVILQPGGSGGATTFTFGEADGKRPLEVRTVAMELRGPSAKTVLTTNLPHEVMHVVLATHFGRPVPRWADEGISVLAEPDEEQVNHEVRARELLNAGRAIRVATLLRMTEYPRDMIVLYCQGYSLCRFLLARGPQTDATAFPYPLNWDVGTRRAALLEFIRAGSAANTAESWAAAAKALYGFDSLDALEQAWIESLRESPRRPGGDRPAAPTAPAPAARPAP